MNRIYLTIVPLLMVMLAAPASAWGSHTHEVVTHEAILALDGVGCDAYFQHHDEIVHTSTLPDLWRACDDPRGDLIYHLSYPSGYGKAPQAAAYWYDRLVEDLAEGKYDEAAFDAGVVSHYVGDALCALHTGPYVPAHGTVETWVNEIVASLELSCQHTSYIEDVQQAVAERSLEASALYDETIRLGEEKEWDALRPVVTLQLGSYVDLLASLLYSAWVDANAMKEEDERELPLYAMVGITFAIIACAALYRARSRVSGPKER